MKRESGTRKSEIWLLGDSNPKDWEKYLDTPFDRRHPTIHNIWTPVIDVIQDNVFRAIKKRVNMENIFTRNAIGNSDRRPEKTQMKMRDGI